MIAAAPSGRPSPPAPLAPSRNHFAEAASMMRERWPVYLGFAAICGAVGVNETVVTEHPEAIAHLLTLRAALILSLVALFFVMPSAVRRVDPGFRLTLWRTLLMIVMFAIVGTVVDLGVALAVIPGVVAGVLLSQAILGALLRSQAGSSFASSISSAVKDSFAMTKDHFATTLGIVTLSLLILAVPVIFAFCALVVIATWVPHSMSVTGPVLFLTFIYFECVRYSLIVRWYGKLRDRARAGG